METTVARLKTCVSLLFNWCDLLTNIKVHAKEEDDDSISVLIAMQLVWRKEKRMVRSKDAS